MAKKKSKRPNLSQETLERARAELRGDVPEPRVAENSGTNGAAVFTPTATTVRPKPVKRTNPNLATRRIPSIPELINEYAYVLRDLRNLLILAGILLAIIIVAAIVLPRPMG